MALVEICGKERELKLTVGTLRRFEKRSGVKLFTALASEIGKLVSSPSAGMSEADAIKLFTGVFPGINEVAAFLYECCVSLKEQQKLGFDEFCDDIKIGSIGPVIRAIMEEIGSFLPEKSEQAAAEGSSDVPLGQ